MNILFLLTPKEEVAHITESDNLGQVLDTMEKSGFTAVPLLSKQGKYIGTVTEGDLLWYFREKKECDIAELEEVPVTAVARHRDNKAVNVHEKLENLFEKVSRQNFVPVVDDDKVFIGIVTRRDVLLSMAKKVGM